MTKRCPKCDSPDPARHPAVQFEGEVQVCRHPFHDPPERKALIARVHRQRAEIQQFFTDIASWNDNSDARKQGCDPIDPDPDGLLRRILDGYDATLAHEAAREEIA